MPFLESLPLWQLFIITYSMRVIDVSLGTVRSIAVIQGRIPLAVILGFCEVLVWVTVVAQVIARLAESPFLGIAYAAGYATGVAVGIIIERYMALGTHVVRFISQHQGYRLAEALRAAGQGVTSFDGMGRDGHCLLIYAITPRKQVKCIIKIAKEIDPSVFYIVETVAELSTTRLLAPSQRSIWSRWGNRGGA